MRLLIIQPTADKHGHFGIYTVKLCQALGCLGHDVTLCTNKVDTSQYLHEPQRFQLWEVGNGRFKFERFDAAYRRFPLVYYWGHFRNSYAVTAAGVGLSRRKRFDAIAIMDAEFMTAALLLRRFHRSIPPVVMFLWASNFSFATYAGSPFKRVYKVVQRTVFKRALGRGIHALAVLDEWHRKQLRLQLGLPAEFPLAVIPDGGEIPANVPDKSAARRKLGVTVEAPLFLFFGILRKDKGIEYLLDAAAGMDSDEFTLIIAGWPMEYPAEQIFQMARRVRAADRVRLRLEYIPDQDVPTYFAACDALILPYTKAYTGGSGPLLKGACTYGRPVIATRVSGMGQLIDRHRIGLVAEPENAQALAEKLREFLRLPEETRTAMAANAAALAAANSWESLAARLTELVSQISA